MKKFYSVLILLLSLYSLSALGTEKIFLGSRLLDFSKDREVITINRKCGPFRGLVVKVTGNGCIVEQIRIIFTDNSTEDIPLKLVFKRFRRIQIIQLEEIHHYIKSIYFTYRFAGKEIKGTTEIIIYGIIEDIEFTSQ